MSARTRRHGRRIKKVARGGAGAFALGLFLAGPQVGAAAADTGQEASPGADSSASSPAGQDSGKAAARTD